MQWLWKNVLRFAILFAAVSCKGCSVWNAMCVHCVAVDQNEVSQCAVCSVQCVVCSVMVCSVTVCSVMVCSVQCMRMKWHSVDVLWPV